MRHASLRSLGFLCLLLSACAATERIESSEPGRRETLRPAASIALVAEWDPVVSSTYNFMTRHKAVAAVMSAGPRTPEASHDAAAFVPLLPKGDANVGDVWTIDVADTLRFLRQLHPSVTPRLRHVSAAVPGGRATLLAKTDEMLEILVRVHCEFELVPRTMFLLPAQFEGHLVWDRITAAPRSFHLALPPRDTNFDIAYDRSIDIGFIPRMQVASANARPAEGAAADRGRVRLREAFYGPQVEWRSLADALARAKRSGKRLHVMQLFGTFDDESC